MSRLRRLIYEVHRRSLWQVLAIYLAASWLVFEIVETLTDGLNLPGWFPAFALILLLVGLPIVMATAFVQHGFGGGERPDPTLIPPSESRAEAAPSHAGEERRAGMRALLTWRNAITGGALAFGLWGVVATGWLLWSDRGPESDGVSASARRSIAVLPFQSLSPAEEDEYFTAGIHEEIITQLTKIRDLKVISRTSVMEYKERSKNLRTIAAELGVASILEGSVRRAGDRVRITAQLIDAGEDEHLWAENYERQLSDIFAIQSDVARQIASALQATMSDAEVTQIEQRPTESVEAYDYYLRGLEHRGRGAQDEINLRAAAQMFEQAIALDPRFAVAYARLSDTHSQMYHWYHDRSAERMALAREAVDSAFAISPSLPEAHRALGLYYYRLLDYDRALEQLELAQGGFPSEAELLRNIGWVERRQGDFEEARTSLQKAIELDPRSAGTANDLAQTLDRLRDYPEAERLFDLRISLSPTPAAYANKAWLYLRWEGSTELARSVLREGAELMGSTVDELWPGISIQLEILDRDFEAALEKLMSWRGEAFDAQEHFVPRSLLHAEILRLMGGAASAAVHYDSARADLERRVRGEPQDPRLHGSLGLAYAGLARREEAIREGRRAVDLLPITTDALRGEDRVIDLARIYTVIGDYDAAIDQLDLLLRRPARMSAALLRVDPTWDPLREDPRFQQLTQRDQ